MNLDKLTRRVANYLTSRPFHEKRHNTVEDDGLIGLLHLQGALLKHDPPFKNSPEGKVRGKCLFICNIRFTLEWNRMNDQAKCVLAIPAQKIFAPISETTAAKNPNVWVASILIARVFHFVFVS